MNGNNPDTKSRGSQQKRQVAYKTRISEIVKGSYVREEGWSPNYIMIYGHPVSRINVVGTVISKDAAADQSYKSLVVDDGSGSIPVRQFEDSNLFDSVELGDAVVIIGRPREFGNERYIIPEILKKIQNNKWIECRLLELGLIKKRFEMRGGEKVKHEEPIKDDVKEVISAETVDEKVSDKPSKEIKRKSTKQRICEAIKELDFGEGADVEQVISKSGAENPEKIINSLLMEGDVFEPRPGKLKVL